MCNDLDIFLFISLNCLVGILSIAGVSDTVCRKKHKPVKGAGRSQFSKKLKIIATEQIGSCSEVCSRTLQEFIFFFQNQFQVILLLQCVFLDNVLYTFINALLYKPEKNQKCERHYNKERNDSRSVLHQFMT